VTPGSFLSIALTLALTTSCLPEPLFASPTPSSKRSQSDRDINAIGHRQIVRGKDRSLYSSEKEKEVGAQLSAEIERSGRVLHDPSVTAYLAALTQNIEQNSDAHVPITVTVIDTDEVNACTSPGGYQYVTRGLLLRLESEGELAGVLAYGIAHSALDLPSRAFLKASLMQLATAASATTVGTNGMFTCTAAIPLSFTFNGMMQADELDADYFGVQYLYKAGYDSECYADFVQRVWPAGPSSGHLSYSFSPFPPVSQRLKDLRREIAEILPQRGEATVSTSAFDEFKEQLRAWQMQHPEPKLPVLHRITTGQ
jgi:beta-barrel assembly-enhancing protease